MSTPRLHTPASLLRETILQAALVLDLQPRHLPLVTVPRDWVEGWRRMLTEALRQLLTQDGAR